MSYNEKYYQLNSQDRDRPALRMYERLWLRYLGAGPALEFGCGVGYFADRISKHTRVFGLEINEFALAQISQNAPEVEGLSTTSDLPKGSIGSIVALHVFEHIPDDQLVSIGIELNRILKPSGRLMAVMPDLEGRAHTLKGLEWSAFTDTTHVNLKSAEEWERLFSEQWGFKVVKSFADGYYDFPYGTNRVLSLVPDSIRAIKTLIQFFVARPILRAGDGENVVFVLEKPL
ncbi:MAG: class I SAM-dependent methyltransferase [Paracoccaceae bacterium]